MRRIYFFYVVFQLFLVSAHAQSNLSIIPKPQSVTYQKGNLVLALSELEVKSNQPIAQEIAAINYFSKALLNKELTFSKAEKSKINITLQQEIYEKQSFYQTKVDKNGISISCNSRGLYPSLSTLVQLLASYSQNDSIYLPFMQIVDSATYSWRGMHLDVCRHFFPVTFIKKYIDLIAFYKMNTFHWHLTEDQGWRIEIKKYPLLTKIGSQRSGSMIGHYRDQKFDTITYGGFYTQEQIKDIVSYAKVRGVTVVPEIELPGHALAALAAYPQYSCTGGPFKVAKSWGVFEDVYCPREETFQFLENVLSEVCDLFPGEYIHIGGDECPKIRWKNCKHCQQLMQREHLKDEHELQSYFIQRIEKFINSKGKKIIGWDEILEGGLAPNAAVMSWRGTEGGIAAAKQKHAVVMTPGSHCYFDHYQGDASAEPIAIGGYTPLQKVYAYDPLPKELNAEEAKYILGAQGNVWTEYINQPKDVEYMAFPRAIALAEVLWTAKSLRDEKDFLNRLIVHLDWLTKLKVNYSESLFQVQFKTVKGQGGLELELIGPGIGDIHYTIRSLKSLRQSKLILPEIYTAAIPITHTSVINAFVKLANGRDYRMLEQKVITSKASAKSVELNKAPDKKYEGRGAFTLVDGIRATTPRKNAEWLAWQDDAIEVLIDLGKIDSISQVTVGYLSDANNWIYPPKSILVSISTDGKKFKNYKEIKDKEVTRFAREALIQNGTRAARYIKLQITSYGKILEGKSGAGNKAWLFLDEILID